MSGRSLWLLLLPEGGLERSRPRGLHHNVARRSGLIVIASIIGVVDASIVDRQIAASRRRNCRANRNSRSGTCNGASGHTYAEAGTKPVSIDVDIDIAMHVDIAMDVNVVMDVDASVDTPSISAGFQYSGAPLPRAVQRRHQAGS